MSDNAMHILLIVVSSLVLINSIIWLSHDNIGKSDRNKSKSKGGVYERVAKELRDEIGEVTEVDKDNSTSVSNSNKEIKGIIPKKMSYSSCIIYNDYESVYFRYLDGNGELNTKTIKSARYIGITHYSTSVRLLTGGCSDIYIDTYKLKLIDPLLAKEFISMVANKFDDHERFTPYSTSQLNALHLFLSKVHTSNRLVSNWISEIIYIIDRWLGPSVANLTKCMYVYDEGINHFRNITTNLKYDNNYIRGVCLAVFDNKLFIECSNMYTHKNDADSNYWSYLYIDTIALYRFDPNLAMDVHRVFNVNSDWTEILEDSSDTLFNVNNLRKLLKGHLPDLDHPCINYLKELNK